MRNGYVLLVYVSSLLLTSCVSAATPLPTRSADGNAQASACTRSYSDDGAGVWLANLIRALCKRGDADSLLAAYAITSPWVEGKGQPDDELLVRAQNASGAGAAAQWLVALSSECKNGETRQCERAVAAAKKLTALDPDNAMAWLTLAYVSDQGPVDAASGVGPALVHAARAPQFHDYGFDIVRLTADKSGIVPVPDNARDSQEGHAESPEHARWSITNRTAPLLSGLVTEWLRTGCVGWRQKTSPPECNGARTLLTRGDSLATLSENREATALLEQQIRRVLAAAERYDTDAAKNILDTALASRSEKEFYATAAPRVTSSSSGE